MELFVFDFIVIIFSFLVFIYSSVFMLLCLVYFWFNYDSFRYYFFYFMLLFVLPNYLILFFIFYFFYYLFGLYFFVFVFMLINFVLFFSLLRVVSDSFFKVFLGLFLFLLGCLPLVFRFLFIYYQKLIVFKIIYPFFFVSTYLYIFYFLLVYFIIFFSLLYNFYRLSIKNKKNILVNTFFKKMFVTLRLNVETFFFILENHFFKKISIFKFIFGLSFFKTIYFNYLKIYFYFFIISSYLFLIVFICLLYVEVLYYEQLQYFSYYIILVLLHRVFSFIFYRFITVIELYITCFFKKLKLISNSFLEYFLIDNSFKLSCFLCFPPIYYFVDVNLNKVIVFNSNNIISDFNLVEINKYLFILSELNFYKDKVVFFILIKNILRSIFILLLLIIVLYKNFIALNLL